jgi:hypothetical protein
MIQSRHRDVSSETGEIQSALRPYLGQLFGMDYQLFEDDSGVMYRYDGGSSVF